MKQLSRGKLVKSERTLVTLETIGIIMRIAAFGMLSLLNKDTPFLLMWFCNVNADDGNHFNYFINILLMGTR